MRRVTIWRSPTGPDRDELIALVDRLTAARSVRPLSDHLWLDLQATHDAASDRPGDGDGDEPSRDGPIVVSAADAGGTLAFAQISTANDGSLVEVVVDDGLPDARGLHDDVLETAVDHFRRDGGGRLTWWVDSDDEPIRRIAAELGLALTRSLHEMRVALPLDVRSEVATRSFTTADADAWLRVNNRAFADHAEQGGWTRETLALRTGEPWFDPDGFRLYEHDGELAAFCWTKLHDEITPPVGEIYVIGVDPDLHGRGLGRQLTLSGLDWMSDHGIATAMLFVDADNVPAVRLYERLGFVVHRTRFAFAGTLER